MQRLVLLLTALAVAALAALFVWVGWDQADRIAIVVAGLVAVAALEVALWTGISGERSAGVGVSHTGPARASKGGSPPPA
jgi:uncharacterized membrane protein YqjE